MNITFWTIVIAFLVSLNCALIGSFLVVRGQSMLVDAISHTSLLGIVISFLLTNSMHPFVILIGAVVSGVISTLCISTLNEQLRIAHDVAINLVLSGFFALAIVLIAMYTYRVDLDLECVLYGQLQMMPFDVWIYDGYNMGPRALYLLLGLLIVNVTFVTLCYPTLCLTSFDPMFGHSIGVQIKLWNYALMVMTAITTVFTYKIVGSILVLAFFILPTATAYMIASSVFDMIGYACLFNSYIAIGGYKLAFLFNSSVPGGMVMVATMFFSLGCMIYGYRKAYKGVVIR